MARLRPPPTSLLGEAQDVEQRFYEALQLGDLDRVMACWAEDDEVALTLADGNRVHGLAAVRQVFATALAKGGLDLRLLRVRAARLGGCACHHVVEQVGLPSLLRNQGGMVLATNVWVATAQGWRLLAQHVGPVASGTAQAGPDTDFGTFLH